MKVNINFLLSWMAMELDIQQEQQRVHRQMMQQQRMK
tara:strand:- start:319 stop:429 length:111 start_codon:yes stop_codon:yes gene_type:complete